MIFGSTLAQEAATVVEETGEKPTKEVVEAPATEEPEEKVVEAPATEESEEKVEEKDSKPEPEVEVEGEEAGEDVEPAEDEAPVKRAKPVNGEKMRVFGWVEWSEVGEEKLRMKARLDTGAQTSSLHAEDVELFERDGVKWVKFTTVCEDDKRSVIEKPLKRIVRIRKAGFKEMDERFVVELNFSIDGIHRRGEFTLSERDHMNYPVLVGRNLLSEFGLVDARRAYIADEHIELE